MYKETKAAKITWTITWKNCKWIFLLFAWRGLKEIPEGETKDALKLNIHLMLSVKDLKQF